MKASNLLLAIVMCLTGNISFAQAANSSTDENTSEPSAIENPTQIETGVSKPFDNLTTNQPSGKTLETSVTNVPSQQTSKLVKPCSQTTTTISNVPELKESEIPIPLKATLKTDVKSSLQPVAIAGLDINGNNSVSNHELITGNDNLIFQRVSQNDNSGLIYETATGYRFKPLSYDDLNKLLNANGNKISNSETLFGNFYVGQLNSTQNLELTPLKQDFISLNAKVEGNETQLKAVDKVGNIISIKPVNLQI